jgi:hypothetical protein
MAQYDACRETVIKQSRGEQPPANMHRMRHHTCTSCALVTWPAVDGGLTMSPVHADIGKLAKQAIFSLHRSDDDEAVQRLDKAAGIAAELAPMVHGEPDLRHGTFSNAMEEVCCCHMMYYCCYRMQKGVNG